MFKGGAHKELRLFCTILIPCHTVRRLRPRIRIYRPVRLPLLVGRHLRRFPLLPQLLDRLAHRRLLLILCDLSGETYSLSDHITCVLNEVPSEIAQIFYQTCDLTNNMKNAYFQVMEQLYKLMGTLVEYQFMRQASLQPQRSISPALRYMDTHIRENTAIPALAHMCMMSESG